jgi:hypothetical protein
VSELAAGRDGKLSSAEDLRAKPTGWPLDVGGETGTRSATHRTPERAKPLLR